MTQISRPKQLVKQRKATLDHDIYILVDPRDSRIHYVGCSYNSSVRLYLHYTEVRRNIHSCPDKRRWLLELKDLNMRPLLVVIETVPPERASEREKFWINELLELGAPLYNIKLAQR